MSRAVNGVSIVTTDGHLGRFGLTVSSMTSVSADPPMLLVCVNRSSAAHDAIRDNGRFAINVLGAKQHKLAAVFAGNSEYGDPYSFDRKSWDLAEALPRLRSATAFFECEQESAMTFGSHSIIVGRVTRSHSGIESPLLYTGRNYGRPVRIL
jgi:flavin reductase